MITGACPNLRSPVLLPEIVTIVANYLFHKAVKVRAYTHSPGIKGMALKEDQLLAEVKTAAASIEGLGPTLQKLHAGTGNVANAANESVSHLDGLVASLVEQTNVLW